MEVSFATPALKKLCESGTALQRKHGQSCAKKIKTRLTDMRAAPRLEEFRHLPGRCHELEGDRKGQLGLDLADGKRLIFKPTHDPPPLKEDGGLDWRAVEAVQVLEIVDYH